MSVRAEDIGADQLKFAPVEWLNFWLNPRRLRGSDFLMRWSQGAWSEERIAQAVNRTEAFCAIPYGPSGIAPDPSKDARAFEEYFERLERAGLGKSKRPDLLIFEKSSQPLVDDLVHRMGGMHELPFVPEDNKDMQKLLNEAIMAVECENSLWKAKQMPDYGAELTPQRWLGGARGLKKRAVVPTLILKEEDRIPLKTWQSATGLPIHIWHAFYDIAFGISLDDAEELIGQKLILPTQQVFQAPSGATARKVIYKIYYHYAYPLCLTIKEPELQAKFVEDRNGHILPYVHFEGGSMELQAEALAALRAAANAKKQRL